MPDVAEQICTGLKKHLEDGVYADITEGEFLAFALTMHTQEVCHDEHLWVRWHPEPLPDDDASLAWRMSRLIVSEATFPPTYASSAVASERLGEIRLRRMGAPYLDGRIDHGFVVVFFLCWISFPNFGKNCPVQCI